MTLISKNKKVLLLYASLNSGHQKAAQAIKEALFLQAPNIETMDIEALKFSYPRLQKPAHKIYMSIVTNLSSFYDFLWDNVSIEKRITKLKELINKNTLDKFEKLFAFFPASVAVCTQALPCGFLATLKQEMGFSFKLVAVITDYDVHAYWIYENVDVYCVATLRMKEKLVQRGVPEEKIKISGIPVGLEFSQLPNRRILREKFGIENESFCVLIMGGSYGIGPLTEIIMNLDKIKKDITMVVVAGKNEKLYKNIHKQLNEIKKPLKLFSYTENIAQLLGISDLLVTKPGGLTISEALCFGLPMIITKGVGGQESGNFRYLLDKNAAVAASDPGDVALKLVELINNNSSLKTMHNNALKIAKPQAATQISKLINSFL